MAVKCSDPQVGLGRGLSPNLSWGAQGQVGMQPHSPSRWALKEGPYSCAQLPCTLGSSGSWSKLALRPVTSAGPSLG